MQKPFEKLNTRVSFYEFRANDGPEPGESEKYTLYSCWALVEKVWMRDLEQAKASGTLEDLTITIRDPMYDFTPTNKMYIGIDDRRYHGTRYNIKTVQPDMEDKRFMRVIAGAVT